MLIHLGRVAMVLTSSTGRELDVSKPKELLGESAWKLGVDQVNLNAEDQLSGHFRRFALDPALVESVAWQINGF